MNVSHKLKLAAVALLLLSGVVTQRLARPPETSPLPAPSSQGEGLVPVARVIDGDTIEIAGGRHVRFVGVNTPETVDPRRPVQCFGKEASAFTHRLLDGVSVRLVRDISDTDKYDRLLRYIYLPDGTFVNLVLVREGYAQVNTYPPDIAHAAEFQAAQREAKSASRGLWGGCPAKKS